MNIELLEGLHLNENGYLVNGSSEQIHLRQGDMDGACGPYCIAMALLAMEKITRNEIIPEGKIDGRKRAGKFLNKIHKLGPLVLGGSVGESLAGVLNAHNQVLSEVIEDIQPKAMFVLVREALKENRPVLIWIKSRLKDQLHHWTLAIGQSEKSIYLLDPGYDLSSSNYWNAVIQEQGGNKFAYRYMNAINSVNIQPHQLLILNRK